MKIKLLHQISTTLSRYSQGTAKHRETMKKVLADIVTDLLDLKIAPPGFHHMTASHITQLIHLWKEKGYAQSTIMNKLGILRNFNRQGLFKINIPSNGELNIKKIGKYRSQYIPEDIVHQVETPITSIILKMQLEFGVTKFEAIRIPLKHCVTDADLTIPTKIAYNQKQRIITMYRIEQREIIKEFFSILGESNTLGDLATDRHIAQLYNAELALLKVDYNGNFRAMYGNRRLAILMKKGFKKEDAYKLLMEEMGYNDKHMLLKAIL